MITRNALIAAITSMLPLQVQAWNFTPGLICLLEHETEQAKITLTYDPAKPLYTVTVARQAPLLDAPFFSMTFTGPSGQTISTNRHQFSPDRRQVTVTDTGFDNVLDGLQFNEKATASIGDLDIEFSLEGAADPTAKFRACETAAGV